MKKTFKYIAILLIIVIAYFIITTYPKLDLISGFAAKSISSHYFIGDRPIKYTELEDNLASTMGMASSEILVSEKWPLRTRYCKWLKRVFFRSFWQEIHAGKKNVCFGICKRLC